MSVRISLSVLPFSFCRLTCEVPSGTGGKDKQGMQVTQQLAADSTNSHTHEKMSQQANEGRQRLRTAPQTCRLIQAAGCHQLPVGAQTHVHQPGCVALKNLQAFPAP